MYYIQSKPNDSGNYGNPTTTEFENSLMLPDELLSEYIECRGFIVPNILDGKVTIITLNKKALDAYLAEHPDVEEEDIPSESEQMRADIDSLAIMMGVEL